MAAPSGVFTNAVGTSKNVWQLGFGGAVLKNVNATTASVVNSTDTGLGQLWIAGGGNQPGGANAQTRLDLAVNAKPYICNAQFDGNNPLPANTGSEGYKVVTTTGANASIGQILWDDGSGVGTVQAISLEQGACISTPVALSGGTITFAAFSVYVWKDAPTFLYQLIGPTVASSVGIENRMRILVGLTSTASNTAFPTATLYVDKARFEVTTAYDAGTVTLGWTGNPAVFQAATDNNPFLVGTYEVEIDVAVTGGPGQFFTVTVAGGPTVGAGVASIWYSQPNN